MEALKCWEHLVNEKKSKICLNTMEEAFIILTNIHEIFAFFEILSRFGRQIVHHPNLEAMKCLLWELVFFEKEAALIQAELIVSN